MKRTLTVLALGLFLLSPRPAAAQVPHLQFVDGLRENGFPDLAVEYLTDLAKKPNLPKELAALLPLELAKSQLAWSEVEGDGTRRAALYADARKNLEAFLQAGGNMPQAAEANLELARIVVKQAKAQMAKAEQEEGPARDAEMKSARAKFEEAGTRLSEAAARIGGLKGDPDRVAEIKLQAEFEQAQNLLDQMLTYDASAEALARAKLGQKALDALKKVALQNDKSPAAWQARAWIIRCYDELDSFQEAENEYRKIEKVTDKAVEPGKRMARFNYAKVLARRDPNNKALLDEVARMALSWLRDYRPYLNTPEGYGMRYRLAQAYRLQAEALKDQKSEAARGLYNQARTYYEQIEKTENEYTQLARRHKVEIMVKQKPELADGDITKLADFNECYLRAQIEVSQLMAFEREAAKDAKKREKLKETEAKHYKNVVQAVLRGLELVNEKVTTQDQVDARYLLIYALLMTNDPYRAAVVGEDLARTYPGSSRAGTAGAYALHAYAQIADQQEREGALDASLKADRERLLALAAYIEATWPNDLAADSARHQRGILALRDKNYPRAVAALSGISPHYGMYAQSQFQLATAALQADKEKAPLPKTQKKPWKALAEDAFTLLPAPDLKDVDNGRFYLYAKAELAKMYFAQKKYDAMDKLTGELAQRLAKSPPALQEELKKVVDPLPLYAKYGKADAVFRSDDKERYAKVRAVLDPVVDAAKAKKLPEVDPGLVRGVLGLALRANVLDGKTDRGRQILELMQQSAGDLESNTAILLDLVRQLKEQVDELKKKGPSAKDELDKTVAQFTSFLDALAKAAGKSMKLETIRFLAFSYSGLGKHDQAAKLLAAVPRPTNPEEEKVYQLVRLMYAREARLSDDLDTAEKVLQEVTKTEYGQKSLDAKKEGLLLLEDRERYAAAANGWSRLMADLKRLKDSTPQFLEEYNEALYRYVYCVYRHAQSQTDPAKQKDYTGRAVKLIVALESADPNMSGMKDKYYQLLEKELPLKQEFEAQKKALR